MNVAVIGGGAAGLACAAELSETGKRINITVFEQNDRVGKKILATGNGRCNLTHSDSSASDYLSVSSANSVKDFDFNEQSNLDFFRSLGLLTYSDEEGRYYPLSNQATSVLDALRLYCECNNVSFQTGVKVDGVTKFGEKYKINNQIFDVVVIATGGAAQVSRFNGRELAENLSHTCSNIYPALVKLTTDSKATKSLKGVRAECKVTLCDGNNVIATEKGEVQFNEMVISGICVMQLSPFVATSKNNLTLYIDFLPDLSEKAIIQALKTRRDSLSQSENEYLLTGLVHKKIGIEVLRKCKIKPTILCKDITDKQINQICTFLKSFDFNITGTKGFNEAQVMLGGVQLCHININTLESKINSNLYFAGEILDITGFCGGYNLNFAWSSGRKVAQSIVNKLK